MSYESGMPMHLAGTAMTWGTVWLLTPMIPVAVLMTLSTSNPGMIDAAGTHWEECRTKLEEYKNDLTTLKKQFDADDENWTADDKLYFDHAVEAYVDELDKLHTTIKTVEDLAKLVAKIFFGLCIFVLAVGGAVLAIALATIAQLPIPIVGELAYSLAQTAALMIMETSLPAFTGIQTALLGFGAIATAVAGGAWGADLITLGSPEPNFKDVTISMPSGPLK